MSVSRPSKSARSTISGPSVVKFATDLRPLEGQRVPEPVPIAGIERLVDAADADRHRHAVDPAPLDGDALTDLEPELARGGAGDGGHDRAVGVRLGRRPGAGDETSVVGQAVRLAEDEDVARGAAGQAVAVGGDGAPRRAQGRAERAGQLGVHDAIDLLGFLGGGSRPSPAGRHRPPGAAARTCWMADRATASERIALATMAVVAMTMVSQAAATRMRSSPMRDTTRPSQPRRVRHRRDATSRPRPLRRASSGSDWLIAWTLLDTARRRARCVVARRAWRDGGRHLLSLAPSWQGLLSARRRCPTVASRPDASGPLEGELHDQLQSFTRRSMVNASGSRRSSRRSPCGAWVSGSTATAGAPAGLAATMHSDGDSTRISARIPSSGQRSSTGVPIRSPRCRRAHRPSCRRRAGRTCH